MRSGAFSVKELPAREGVALTLKVYWSGYMERARLDSASAKVLGASRAPVPVVRRLSR
jgi:hypothetical protein